MHSLELVHMHVRMFATYGYNPVIYACILPYFQQYFATVPESHEYYKIQIMQSLNEPNTGEDSSVKHIFYISAK